MVSNFAVSLSSGGTTTLHELLRDGIDKVYTAGGANAANAGGGKDQKNKSNSNRSGGIIIFTYPKASTPGCTKWASTMNKFTPLFVAAQIRVLGMSRDSAKANESWRQKLGLKYELISAAADAMTEIGSLSENSVARTIILIEKSGKNDAKEALKITGKNLETSLAEVLEYILKKNAKNPSLEPFRQRVSDEGGVLNLVKAVIAGRELIETKMLGSDDPLASQKTDVTATQSSDSNTSITRSKPGAGPTAVSGPVAAGKRAQSAPVKKNRPVTNLTKKARSKSKSPVRGGRKKEKEEKEMGKETMKEAVKGMVKRKEETPAVKRTKSVSKEKPSTSTAETRKSSGIRATKNTPSVPDSTQRNPRTKRVPATLESGAKVKKGKKGGK